MNERMKALSSLVGRTKPKGYYTIQCVKPNGDVRWVDTIENLIPNDALDHILDVVLASGVQITTWYLGLTDGTPTPAAGDTMGSHTGWSEVTAYSEGVRQTWTPGSVASQSVDNSGTVASFSINGTVTIGGCFLASDSAKSGSTGTLYSVGAFSAGDKGASSGDTLNVTFTATQTDDGV